VQAWLETVSGVPFDENDLEEDVDSEPAEIEGEAAENGDTGDTGAELDDGTGDPRASPLHCADRPLPHCVNATQERSYTLKQKQGTQKRPPLSPLLAFLVLALT